MRGPTCRVRVTVGVMVWVGVRAPLMLKLSFLRFLTLPWQKLSQMVMKVFPTLYPPIVPSQLKDSQR